MKSQKLRVIIPLGLLAVAGVAYAAHASVGTLSAFGWESISLICPVGALGTMLASKTMVPRAVISVVLAVAAILVLGRAFCGWLCPVPVWQKLRGLFKKQEAGNGKDETAPQSTLSPLTASEKKALSKGCSGGCASCASHADRKPADSRHFILGGTLLSAAIFGFPVFCLVCPVGLSFALVFLLIALFGAGDVTWSVLLIPLLLLAEVVFFRKWCSHLCPISSLMSLVAKANRTFQPAINDEKCLETAHGATCGRCAEVCEVAINPRHPQLGTTFNECTRCRACADACPGNAITFPLLSKRPAITGVPAADDAPAGVGAAADLDEPLLDPAP
ncbi:MAG: 4Fe-4S binding protein [Adlercreutzia sp.]|nr:4Fe-4S binding protein [Adlercreutzia sp.]